MAPAKAGDKEKKDKARHSLQQDFVAAQMSAFGDRNISMTLDSQQVVMGQQSTTLENKALEDAKAMMAVHLSSNSIFGQCNDRGHCARNWSWKHPGSANNKLQDDDSPGDIGCKKTLKETMLGNWDKWIFVKDGTQITGWVWMSDTQESNNKMGHFALVGNDASKIGIVFNVEPLQSREPRIATFMWTKLLNEHSSFKVPSRLTWLSWCEAQQKTIVTMVETIPLKLIGTPEWRSWVCNNKIWVLLRLFLVCEQTHATGCEELLHVTGCK